MLVVWMMLCVIAFNKDILHGEKYNYRTYRKYKNDIFEILETVLDQTLPEGWSENEFSIGLLKLFVLI